MGHASNSRVERHDEWEDRPAPAVAQSLESHGLLTPAAEPPKKTGVLGDVAVYVYGFDKKKTATLRTALDSLAASVAASVDVLAGSKEVFKCVLLPRDMRTSEYPTLPNGKVHVVTEWWLEACLHHKYLVQPSDNNITTMRFQTYPIPGKSEPTTVLGLANVYGAFRVQ